MPKRKIGSGDAFGYIATGRNKPKNVRQSANFLFRRATGNLQNILEDVHREAESILIKLFDDMARVSPEGTRGIGMDYNRGNFRNGPVANPEDFVVTESQGDLAMMTYVATYRRNDLGYRFHILNKGRVGGFNQNKGRVILEQITTGTTTPNSLQIKPPDIVYADTNATGRKEARIVIHPGKYIRGFEPRNFYGAIEAEINNYILKKYGKDVLNLIKVTSEND